MNRWLIVGVFVLSTAINYLDRQTLATAAPLLRTEFSLSNTQYGWVVAAFSLTYAASAPFAGWLTDRIGLNRAISAAILLWSAAGIASGFSRGLWDLAVFRALLGVGEAAGIPAAAKTLARYLKPSERALGNGLNQVAVSLGLILAPPLVTWIALRAGWRAAFFVTGSLGLLWIPLWRWVASPDPPGVAARTPFLASEVPQLALLMAANASNMILYSLWTNWTTLFLVDSVGLTLAAAARFAWIPPVFGALGGVAGGWLALRWARGRTPFSASLRVCAFCAAGALVSAAAPFMGTAAGAVAVISWSMLCVAAFSVNLYSMPLDLFGAGRAAFSVSLLVASYGLMQMALSPLLGFTIDRAGYGPACVAACLTPAISVLLLSRIRTAA